MGLLRRYLLSALVLSGVLYLDACGGGSGSSSTNPPQNPVPTVTSVTPNSVLAGASDTSITIAGSGFISSSSVRWNGASLTTQYQSATGLTAIIPQGNLQTAATSQVTVSNPAPGGGTSSQVAFNVDNPSPEISSVTPLSVTAGAGSTTLDIRGAGYVAASTVLWNSSSLTTTFVSATELNAVVPAANLSGSSNAQISVQNPTPGGGTSTATGFTVNSPSPVIASLTPRYVPPGSAATITLTGTGFESNSIVQWNGSGRPTAFTGSTSLQVSLSATDLQTQGTGAITVMNPAPGGSVSSPVSLSVTAQPLPIISGVTISPATGLVCPLLRVAISGQNFTPQSTVQANGVALQSVTFNGSTSLAGFLPSGFTSQPGSLSFTVSDPYPPLTSDPFSYPPTAPAAIALCPTPNGPTVYAGSSFSFALQPSEVNISGNGSLTIGSLPAGITTSATTVTMPPAGVTLYFQADSTTAAGSDTIALNATAGSATGTGNLSFTVNTGTAPGFFFVQPLSTELGVPIGGTGQIQFETSANGTYNVDYDVTPSVSGLPPGTSATFSPNPFMVGQSLTVTLSAASNAPVTQNQIITLTGTPSAQASPGSIEFFVDVTQPPGSLPGSRTDFVSTAGTPYGAVYDPTHNLIFSSNPSWNRIDVISNQTHKIVKQIPVRSPRGIDITPDFARVWVQAASQNVYEIDTTTLQASTYWLPNHSVGSAGLPVSFSSDQILALADGTLFLYYNDNGGGGGGTPAVWNPTNNQLNVLSVSTGWNLPVRSGDGTHVYSVVNGSLAEYSTSTRAITTVGSGNLFGPIVAANQDGTKLIIGGGSSGAGVYDQSLNLLGPLPGATFDFGLSINGGGAIFGADGSRIYILGSYDNQFTVLTVDSSSLAVLAVAPALATEAVGTSGGEGPAAPFAADANGMVLGLQLYGISFDDSAFAQNYISNQPGTNGTPEYIAAFAGPLAGGTSSSIYLFPALTPDVWFGQSRGTTSLNPELTFTSPPGSMPGPVNIKFIFPDGTQLFYPQLFSYATFPEYSVFSGSSPEGGAPAEIIGYGLPQDPSGGTVTVGGNTATITTTAGQYPPFSGEPYPSTKLNYTFPAGTPGWADLEVSTPIGTGTLPRSVFYAQSVTDYTSKDTFTAVLADPTRRQVYLAAGDHIDVFSTSTNTFVTPLYPAAQGSSKQFTGMALTPDGSKLLAADLLDGSLAVINPDSPTGTYAIPIAGASGVGSSCAVGPLYVAATSNNMAFVTTGGLPATACPSEGITYIANLQTQTVSRPSAWSQCNIGLLSPPFSDGFSVDASADGNYVAIGSSDYSKACVYSVQSGTYTPLPIPYNQGYGWGVSLSADANMIGSGWLFGDVSGDLLGSIAKPIPLYPNSTINPAVPLLRPRLNASGSLYYLAFPNSFEIVDVPHSLLRLRFSLTENVQNVASPIAIDSGGRYVYLITDKGLTVVDLGSAPLSIGHLSQQIASIGTAVTVRGSGFNASTTATVGGTAASVTVKDQNTLTLTIPAISSGPQDIVLSNSGGENYTLENGIQIQ